MRHLALYKEKIGKDPEQQSFQHLLSNLDDSGSVGPLMSSLDGKIENVALDKQVSELQKEIEQYRKMNKTLEIELREKDDQLKALRGGKGDTPAAEVALPTPEPPVISSETPPESEATSEGGPPPPPPPGGVGYISFLHSNFLSLLAGRSATTPSSKFKKRSTNSQFSVARSRTG
jgi:hypothetical protein